MLWNSPPPLPAKGEPNPAVFRRFLQGPVYFTSILLCQVNSVLELFFALTRMHKMLL